MRQWIRRSGIGRHRASARRVRGVAPLVGAALLTATTFASAATLVTSHTSRPAPDPRTGPSDIDTPGRAAYAGVSPEERAARVLSDAVPVPTPGDAGSGEVWSGSGDPGPRSVAAPAGRTVTIPGGSVVVSAPGVRVQAVSGPLTAGQSTTGWVAPDPGAPRHAATDAVAAAPAPGATGGRHRRAEPAPPPPAPTSVGSRPGVSSGSSTHTRTTTTTTIRTVNGDEVTREVRTSTHTESR